MPEIEDLNLDSGCHGALNSFAISSREGDGHGDTLPHLLTGDALLAVLGYWGLLEIL